MLGVGGQIVEERLTRIEQHLGLDQESADVVPLNANRSPKAAVKRRKTGKNATTGAKRPTKQADDWVYAASRDDGQPDEARPASKHANRPFGPDVHPEDDFNQDPGD